MSTAHCPPSTVHYARSTISGAIGVLAGLFACAALVIAWRRLSGALVSPLPPALLIPSGLLACLSALGIRTLWRHSTQGKIFSRGGLVLDILLGLSLLIFAAALSLPGTNAWGFWSFWLFIAAEEVWAFSSRAGVVVRASRLHFKLPKRLSNVFKQPGRLLHDPRLIPPNLPARDVTQQLTRSTAADGSDVLSGWLRLDFAAGQRLGNLHVAFCPPFVSTPELTVAQLDGPETRIKIAQLLPYGVRLDLKLVAFSEQPASVLVQFSARSK